MRILLFSLAAFAAVCFAPYAVASSCPTLPDKNLQCVSSPNGWFYAKESKMATEMATAAGEAADLFQRYFGRPAPKGAIVSTEGKKVAADAESALKAAGATWVMPFGDPRKLIDRMPPEQLAALPAEIRASWENPERLPSYLRHETGHHLFNRVFWSGKNSSKSKPRSGYGSQGPDWLDELAAVLMENAWGKTRYYTWLREQTEQGKKLLPLADFFAAAHPVTEVTQKIDVATAKEGGVRIFQTDDDKSTVDFYAQTRAFADFLIEYSKNEGIFGEITPAIAAGDTMADWLTKHGVEHGLPGTVDALEREWRVWLDRLAQDKANGM